jgi:hypothetical protein
MTKTTIRRGELPMYQPLITDENIQRLYRMKLKEKRPMTKLINQILDDFFLFYDHDPTERREMTWMILIRVTNLQFLA